MATPAPQNYANHRKFVPLYHFVAFPILVTYFGYGAWRCVSSPSFHSIIGFALGFALIVLFFAMRIFSLTVQDRLIRLEMRLRLKELLPADLFARSAALTVRQLVSLRFAGDREMPALVKKVLDENIVNGEAIKKLIGDWQADHQRC